MTIVNPPNRNGNNPLAGAHKWKSRATKGTQCFANYLDVEHVDGRIKSAGLQAEYNFL